MYTIYPYGQDIAVSFTAAAEAPVGTTYDLIDNGVSAYRFPSGMNSTATYRPTSGTHTLEILVTAPDGRTSRSGFKGISISGDGPLSPSVPSLVIGKDTNSPNALSITCVAPQGVTYNIQKSHDLITWETIDTVTGNGQVSVMPVVIDPTKPKAFYRMVEVTR